MTAPATGEVVGSVPMLDAAAVRVLVERARAAQPAWAALSPRARGRLLLRLRDHLALRAEEVADLSCRETGKLPAEALLSDVLTTCDLARWYARRAPAVLRRRRIPAGWLVNKRCYEVREPYGVVGVIGPWNFPVLNTMRAALAALAAGNAVVLKPSEAAPLSALLMEELAQEAGWPPDLLLVATGDGSTGAALIEAGVDKLSFTGSVATGRAVARMAAERLIPVTLELGGKDPMLVLAGADLDRAARAAVAGAFWNAGQICTSVERVYVEESAYHKFLERVLREVAGLVVGPASDPASDVGALTTEAQLERLDRHIADAVSRGARLLAGGHRLPGPGRFFAPTVLADVDHSMDVMREETFGPLLPVMRVRDAEQALRLANDCAFGLGSSIFGPTGQAMGLVSKLRAGMTCVNDALINAGVPGLPFGGTGESGYGRVYGDEGLREMSRTRAVLVSRIGWKFELPSYPLRRWGRTRALALVELLHGPGLLSRLRGLRRLVSRAPAGTSGVE
ncbi:MAG: aldehyde dehydrogenase family protein [Gemmatimonadetes bacterium]|nr:aldehyde dehydrogenase family protein [Gemmatimonadota bacterium]